jgi:hypothetical protein
MATSPNALQLRYLQTLTEIAVEKNSTIIFPLPLDLIEPLLAIARKAGGAEAASNGNSVDGPYGAYQAQQRPNPPTQTYQQR